MNNKQYNKGITLIELIIVVSIISMFTIVMATFQADIFNLGFGFQSNLSAQFQAERMLKNTASEIRSAESSSSGAYPVAVANESTFTFFSDADGDGLKEKIRYFLEGTLFKRGIIVPEGAYHVYSDEDEEIVTLLEDVRNTNIFTFYDENYNGVSSTTALTFPVNISDIRLVQIILEVDNNVSTGPGAMVITTEAMMRNLKDNL